MVYISDTGREATLAISDDRPYLIGNKNDPKKVAWAIEPAKGFIWPKELIAAAKGHIVNDFTRCVWGAIYPKEEYKKCEGRFVTLLIRMQP